MLLFACTNFCSFQKANMEGVAMFALTLGCQPRPKGSVLSRSNELPSNAEQLNIFNLGQPAKYSYVL